MCILELSAPINNKSHIDGASMALCEYKELHPLPCGGPKIYLDLDYREIALTAPSAV